jgi:hypothetical protein
MSLTAAQFRRYRQILITRTRPSTSPDHCACGTTITCPMLRDEIWALIARGDRFLCLPCAESRLCRELQVDDLGACHDKLADKRAKRRAGDGVGT